MDFLIFITVIGIGMFLSFSCESFLSMCICIGFELFTLFNYEDTMNNIFIFILYIFASFSVFILMRYVDFCLDRRHVCDKLKKK